MRQNLDKNSKNNIYLQKEEVWLLRNIQKKKTVIIYNDVQQFSICKKSV